MAAKRHTGRVLFAVFAASVLVATACTSGGPTASSAPTAAASATEKPVQGGRIIEGSFSDIKILNPMLVNDVPSATVTGRIFDALFYADPKTGELKPNLGSWTVTADGLTYSWEINATANWSDGKPIIAEDYLTAVKAVARSKLTVRKSNFELIEGFNDYCVGPASCKGTATSISGIKIDTANPKKFTVKFISVFCPAAVNAFGTSAGPLPTHIYGKYTVDNDNTKNIDAAPENSAPTVTSGPFKFKEWRKGDQVILDRNDTYFKGAPYTDQYVFKVVADSTVAANQLKTGEINFYPGLEPKDLDDIERQDALRVIKFQQLSYTYIGWNVKSTTAPALADKRVRQALAYGLDMDAVVKQIVFGQGTKMVAHHPPVSWAFPSAGMEQYAFNKTKAEDLIKSAGYAKAADGFYAKDGKQLQFSVVANTGNKTRETLLQVATEQYKAIGVKLNPKLEAFETMVDKLTKGNQEIEGWIIGWSLGIEPDPYGIWHSTQIPDPSKSTTGFNFGGFTAPGFDKAIEEGRTPSNGDCSQANRKKNYETFNKILNDEQPYNFGFSPNALVVSQKNMKNLDPGTFSTYWNIEKWWFSK